MVDRALPVSLGAKQRAFTRMVGQLIAWAYAHGYELTFGEAWRTDEQAEINAMGNNGRERFAAYIDRLFPVLAYKIRNNTGNGTRTSLHMDRLAVDFNLFKGGVYLQTTEDYRPLGEVWEAMGGTWGGRFGDAPHFSLPHEGRK